MPTKDLPRREAQIQRALAGTLSRARRSDLMAELFEISEVLDRRMRSRGAR